MTYEQVLRKAQVDSAAALTRIADALEKLLEQLGGSPAPAASAPVKEDEDVAS